MPIGRGSPIKNSHKHHHKHTKSSVQHQQHAHQQGPSSEELASLQVTELEVLTSIFGPDLKHVESEALSPWHKTPPSPGAGGAHQQQHFDIILRPDTDELKPLVSASVRFRLPIRYPVLPPIIIVLPPSATGPSDTKGISTDQAKSLQVLLINKAKELVVSGGEMIWEIVSVGQEWISVNNLHLQKDPNRSLEEEKLLRERETEQARRVKAQQESQQRNQVEAERASKIAHLIQEQTSQQTAAIKEEREKQLKTVISPSTSKDNPYERLVVEAGVGGHSKDRWIETFEDPIVYKGARISSIIVGPMVRDTGFSFVHYVEPVAGKSSSSLSWQMEYFPITSRHYNLSSGKRKLQEVEGELEKLRMLDCDALINVLACALVSSDGAQQNEKKLLVVTEAMEGPSVKMILSHCMTLPWTRVRCYLLEILSGLDALHSKNLLHRAINLENIYLEGCASFDRDMPGAKLARAAYWKKLADMNEGDSLTEAKLPTLEVDLPGGWEAPELSLPSTNTNYDRKGSSYSRKRDIWQTGVTAVQMLFGADITTRYSSVDAFFNSEESLLDELGTHIIVYLKSMLEKSTKKRPSANELKSRLEEVIRYEEEERKEGSKTILEGQKEGEERAEGPPMRRKMIRGISEQEDLNFRPGSFWQFSRNQSMPTTGNGNVSRYESDFEEMELLGKGAYGAVFKARNRLDGRDYAIKKIRLSPSAGNDERTLREISALSRLSHQHIVRYVTCWIQTQEEKDAVPSSSGGDVMTSSRSLQTSARDFIMPGLDDFLSVGHDAFSTSGQNIRFANSDSDSSEDEEEEQREGLVRKLQTSRGASVDQSETDSDSDSSDSDNEDSQSDWQASHANKSRVPSMSQSQFLPSSSTPRWLFIQMEYVENQTLKEAIDRGLSIDESWRLFRQMIEALTHVSSLGIIHRDLKPSNILMFGGGSSGEEGVVDSAGDIKIGDFGLATTTPQQLALEGGGGGAATYGTAEDSTADLTTEIGTNLYIAPEVEKAAGSRYDYKVDIYATGIIFFEMLASQRVYKTGMERISVIRDLRSPDVCFPKGWNEAQMPAQTKIIRMLLSHDPSSRPSPLELLKSELLPPKMEDEYIAECLRLLSTPNSTYNLQLMDSLFGKKDEFEQREARDFTFDTGSNTEEGQGLDNRFVGVACQHLRSLFHRRGAVELEAPLLIPPNELYNEDQKPVELLDKTGKVVQLPYDLVVPFARMVARGEQQRFKRYAMAPVYRNNLLAGGQPRSVIEVDYDIVAPDKTAAAEAEVLGVVDEILEEIPGFDSSEWVIQISHSHLLDLLLERVPVKHRQEALMAIGTLFSGSKTAASNMRSRLNNLGLGIPRSILDEIEMANLSDEVEIVSEKLQRLVALDLRPKLMRAIEEIKQVVEACKHFGLQRRFLLTPLLITNRSFYQDNVFFVVVRARGKRRDILASGGRYNALLKRFTNPALTRPPSHAVGIQIGLGRIALALAKHQESLMGSSDRILTPYAPSRCDVYVASGPDLLSLRMEICKELWAANISADLAYELALENSPELLASTCKAEGILFLVIARARHSSIVKVKSIYERGEYEVNRWELSTWLSDRIHRLKSNVEVNLTIERGNVNTVNAPTFNPLEAEVMLPERYSSDKRRADKHGNNDRRVKKHLAPIQENSVRQVTKVIEDLNPSGTGNSNGGNIPIIAVDVHPIFNFNRLCAAAMARNDEGLWKLFMECVSNPEERDYARQIRRRIEELDGKRAWLVSIRQDGATTLI